MSSESEKKKSIVIVGGGFAGATIARTLSGKLDAKKHSLILITVRPFLVNFPATIRTDTAVVGKNEDNVFISYDKLFVKKDVGAVKLGHVTAIEASKDATPGAVVLEGGEKVAYDVLILAPGNQWSGPLDIPNTKDEALAHVEEWRSKFKGAKNVVIVGGGAVGIEFAGEVRDFYPQAKATIVHKEPLLINDYFPEKFRRAMEKDIRAAGAEVILGDSIDDLDLHGDSVTTHGGKKLDADLIVPAFGGKPATGFVSSSLGADSLAENGRIKVTKTLQLPQYSNIFAAGDASDTDESKQVVPAYFQASVVAVNVLAILNGQEPKKAYSKAPSSILISNGRKRGLMYVGVLWGLIIGNFISSMIKNFLFSYTKKNFGQ